MHFYFLHTNELSIIMTNELNPGHLTVFPNLAFWPNHIYSWPVTYGQREVLVLWRHIRELFLHALINWRKADLHQCYNHKYRFPRSAVWYSRPSL